METFRVLYPINTPTRAEDNNPRLAIVIRKGISKTACARIVQVVDEFDDGRSAFVCPARCSAVAFCSRKSGNGIGFNRYLQQETK